MPAKKRATKPAAKKVSEPCVVNVYDPLGSRMRSIENCSIALRDLAKTIATSPVAVTIEGNTFVSDGSGPALTIQTDAS